MVSWEMLQGYWMAGIMDNKDWRSHLIRLVEGKLLPHFNND